ncbi:HpcH/HpaI aldolase family protein [Flavobacterium yafengii]|uniref:HpcH/HpaI aldolase family protein n=1 Tax=Flavobacterium yafengii TaxID=3041253 RepID=UPI0024A858C7|nr:aldolase/citrate lyase family protein [Flavobacterium yafengii]MDI6046864.1 aldolase/citrate lyase family protein [Flavobacterium yafengii]
MKQIFIHLLPVFFLFGFGSKSLGCKDIKVKKDNSINAFAFTEYTKRDSVIKKSFDTVKNSSMKEKLKERISKGEVLKGAVIDIAHPTFIEVVCAAGADFLFLDFEHGLHDYNDIGQAIRTAELSNVSTLVRLGERSSNLTVRMLDAGATGILFPHVETAEEAAEFVSWCRYKPLGIRGSGFARASISYSGNEYERRQQASKDVVCIMIVESLKGKENLAKILAVEGVSGVFISQGSISMELGLSDWKDPKVVKVLDEMATVVKSFPNSAFLRLSLTPDEAVKNVASGANMILLTHDWQLIKGMYSGLFNDITNKLNQAAKK